MVPYASLRPLLTSTLGVAMNMFLRGSLAFVLAIWSTAALCEILKCTFSFGGDLIGALSLSVPESSEPRILLSARADGTPLNGVASLPAIGDVEYAPLREQRSIRYTLLIANRTPLLATFIAVDRVVSIRVEREHQERQLLLYDPWFSKDKVAIGDCS